MALFFEKKYNTLIQNTKDTNMGQINRDDMLGPGSIWQMIYAIRECEFLQPGL